MSKLNNIVSNRLLTGYCIPFYIISIPRNPVHVLPSAPVLPVSKANLTSAQRVMTFISCSEQPGSHSIVPCACVKTHLKLIHLFHDRSVSTSSLLVNYLTPPLLFSSTIILLKVRHFFFCHSRFLKKKAYLIH